jgi:hypothetical protein
MQNNHPGNAFLLKSKTNGKNLSIEVMPLVVTIISFAFSRISSLQSQAYTTMLSLALHEW